MSSLAEPRSLPLLPQLLRSLYAGLRTEAPFEAFLRELVVSQGASWGSLTIEDKDSDQPRASLHWSSGIEAEKPPGSWRKLELNRQDGENRQIGLSLLLPEAQSNTCLAYLDALAPDLEGACALNFDLAATRSRETLYGQMLARLGVGAMVVDGAGRILHITERARQQLLRNGLLALAQDRVALASSCLRDETLRAALAASLATKSCDSAGNGKGTGTGTGTGSDLWPVPMRNAKGDVLNLTFRPSPWQGTALVTLCEAARNDMPAIRTLSRLYGLTPAEAALAALLAQGMDLNAASALLAISRNTAKCQLRMIFGKTRVSRQSSLVRLLLKSVDELIPATLPADATGHADQADKTFTLQTGDSHDRH